MHEAISIKQAALQNHELRTLQSKRVPAPWLLSDECQCGWQTMRLDLRY
jgi:hypothetical protein